MTAISDGRPRKLTAAQIKNLEHVAEHGHPLPRNSATPLYPATPAETQADCDVGRLRRRAVMSPQLMDRLVEALQPFADLAAPRYREEGGAPSIIDIMTLFGELDELDLRGSMAVSDTIANLDGSDFRRAFEVVELVTALRQQGREDEVPKNGN